MATFGKWGAATFTVTSKKVYKPLGVSRKAAGTRNSITNLPEGKDPEQIALSIKVGAVVGVDVRAEIEWWISQINKANPLIIGGARYGSADMILDSVDSGDPLLSDGGKFIETEIKLSFSAKPSLNQVISALTADANARAASASDDKEKKKILNAELAAAKAAATKVFNAT
jgi:hypothetical protein